MTRLERSLGRGHLIDTQIARDRLDHRGRGRGRRNGGPVWPARVPNRNPLGNRFEVRGTRPRHTDDFLKQGSLATSG